MINVLWMYPDILNLHGERANAKAFEMGKMKFVKSESLITGG